MKQTVFDRASYPECMPQNVHLILVYTLPYLWEPLKTGVKSKNGQGVPDSRKADEVRLYALRGGLTTKMVRTAHFRSHEVFRGDFIIHKQFIGVNMDCSRKKHMLFDDPLDLHLAEKQVLPAKRAFLFLTTVFPG